MFRVLFFGCVAGMLCGSCYAGDKLLEPSEQNKVNLNAIQSRIFISHCVEDAKAISKTHDTEESNRSLITICKCILENTEKYVPQSEWQNAVSAKSDSERKEKAPTFELVKHICMHSKDEN